jgi:hypothetical protein
MNTEEVGMPQSGVDRATDAATADSSWSRLYRIAGAAALLTALVFIPISMVVYLAWPPPDTVAGHFALFQTNKLLGLLGMDLIYLVINVLLSIPIFLALYVALRRTNESIMLIAATLCLIGTVALIPSRPAFEMLSLSNQYAAATTDAQRAIFLAAGEALWALFRGTSYQVHLVLGSVALVMISIVMLRGTVFGRTTAYMGILANVLVLGYYVPGVGTFLLTFSVLFYWIWSILIGWRFRQLGRGVPEEVAARNPERGGAQ